MHALALSLATLVCMAAGLSSPTRPVVSAQPAKAVEAPESDAVAIAAADIRVWPTHGTGLSRA